MADVEKDLMLYQPIITDIKEIISAGQQRAYNAANTAMVLTYCTSANGL